MKKFIVLVIMGVMLIANPINAQAKQVKAIDYKGMTTIFRVFEVIRQFVVNANTPNDEIPCYWADFTITPEEYDLICTTVWCESGNQDFDTQVMVALTILNRLESDLFPDTVREVIYSKGAYSVTNWKSFESYGWTDSVEEAVGYALEHNEHPKDLFYFRTKHYHKFGKPYMKSDDLWFSTQG